MRGLIHTFGLVMYRPIRWPLLPLAQLPSQSVSPRLRAQRVVRFLIAEVRDDQRRGTWSLVLVSWHSPLPLLAPVQICLRVSVVTQCISYLSSTTYGTSARLPAGPLAFPGTLLESSGKVLELSGNIFRLGRLLPGPPAKCWGLPACCWNLPAKCWNSLATFSGSDDSCRDLQQSAGDSRHVAGTFRKSAGDLWHVLGKGYSLAGSGSRPGTIRTRYFFCAVCRIAKDRRVGED